MNSIDHGLIGRVALGMGKTRPALGHLDQSLYLDFQNTTLLKLRGKAHLELGDYELALADFEACKFYQKQDEVALRYAGLVKLKSGDTQGAFIDLMAAKKINPTHPDLHLFLAYYYQVKKEYLTALEHFESAKKLGSTHHGLDFEIEHLKGLNN